MVLLIFLIGILLIRPAEVFTDLEALPIYYWTIIAALVINFDRLVRQVSKRAILERPILACVMGILPAGVMSRLTHLETIYARAFAEEFIRVVLFYLLLTGIVDSVKKFQLLLIWVAIFTALVTGMAVLDYHEIVDFPSINSVKDDYRDSQTGQLVIVKRMCGSGVFNDPNDLCMILVVGISISLYFVTKGILYIPWIAPLGFFVYALTLTHSRGGLLAMLLALLTIFQARFGWKKAIPFLVIGLPVMVMLIGGRQAEITTQGGTGAQRIQLWSYGFTELRGSPLFGTGTYTYPEFAGGLVAHNSFVQGYVEIGLVGGTLFFAMHWFPLTVMQRLKSRQDEIPDPELRRARPYVMGLLAGSIGSMFSVSRNYTIPIYLFIGINETYLRLASAAHPDLVPRLDKALVKRMCIASAIFFTTLYVYTRTSARFGV